MFPFNQIQIIKQANFSYSPFGKAFENQTKVIVFQGKKQVEALEVLKLNTQKLIVKDVILKNTLSEEAKDKLNKN